MSNFKEEINNISKQGYLRKRLINYSPQDVIIKINNKKLLSFASNDYLGLANNSDIKKAFIKAIDKYGVGAGSSPIISGYSVPHQKLEEDLSHYLGFDSVLVTNSGYLSNVGVVNAISKRDTVVFQDRENHNSIIESSRLSSTKLVRYKHLSTVDLKNKLTEYSNSKNKIIFTDSVFSMTGEISPLEEILKLKKLNKANIFVDDAHGFCVMNCLKETQYLPSICSYLNLNKKNIDAYIGTFGKAVGTFGSFVAGKKSFIELLVQKSKPYIYSTALPPSIAEATRASLKIIKKNKSFHEKLYNNINYFIKNTDHINKKLNDSVTPIQSFMIGNPQDTITIQKKAFKDGIFLQAIRYPTVPKNHDKLRISITSKHTKKHLDKLIKFLSKEL